MTSQRSSDDYQPLVLEKKWQDNWDKQGLYLTPDTDTSRPNRYHATMLPYPSGDLHIGHWWAMAPSDMLARFYRMNGYNVLFPMGFDAFGLPAENAAIQRGIHPQEWTTTNIERMRGQLKRMGAMFDWSREINTSSPDYYRWTQWWFLQLFKNGLAYRTETLANWCPKCQTTLANEQVVREGVCERCESPVSQKSMPQWLFKITEYAEELLDFSDMNWPNSVLRMQENWIGKSEGAEIIFDIDSPNISESLSVFTTRPDTLYGVTFMVLAPEHPLVNELVAPEFSEQIKLYQEDSARVSEIERQSTVREKTGVFTGAYCLNPMNNEKVPIWIADYVLATYGTGAIMAVPAHDQRDFEFAKKYELPIRVVIAPENWSENQELEEAYTGKGNLVNSQEFTSLDASDAITKVIQHVERNNFGNKKTQYRIRDWLISRQRYWGAPIPIIHCDVCGTVPVSEDELPIKLPTAVEFLPTGQSPLALAEEFVNVRCPECGTSAKRETDTMDTFMCSSWYVYRYTDPANMNSPVGPIATENWPAVDQYTGGAEHAVMHLLYARFFHKFGRDIGVLRGNEPFLNYFAQGQVLGTDGQRMSKSRGNVVAPDEIVDQWGSDAFRAHLAFMGPWENGGPYSEGIVGISRWLNRIWILVNSGYSQKDISGHDEQLLRLVNQTIQRVTRDLGEKSFNTAIAALMELTNALSVSREKGNVTDENWEFATKTLLLLLAPIAPHISEELWQRSGKENSIHLESWPTIDKSALIVSEIEIPVQINGKLKTKIMVPSGATEDVVIELAKATDQIGKLLSGEPVKRIIYVENRLLNIVL
jgi:leucyl-tRNA synthetase|tara:strand:+ start:100 stop:2556 length:2457 start_codon:yes stop_codon:yes gene_type:complete